MAWSTVRKDIYTRKSTETEISIELNIDGQGKNEIKTPIGFLNHMLELFSFHGFFDLKLEVIKGDMHVDSHHTNEDTGIALGKAFKKILGEEKFGIKRFGSAFAPMEETLGHTVIDICGRPHLELTLNKQKPESQPPISNQREYSFKDLEHFLLSFAKNLGATIIVTVTTPEGFTTQLHELAETVFKSLGMALDQATQIDPRREGKIPSTKGIID